MSAAAGANESSTGQVGDAAPRQQRNSQQGGGGNRGRSNRTSGGERPQHQRPKKFAGKEEVPGDERVHQRTKGCNATDQRARMTEEIVQRSSAKHESGGDVERSLPSGAAVAFTMPVTPAAVAPAQPADVSGVAQPAPMARTPERDTMLWKMEAGLVLQRRSLHTLQNEVTQTGGPVCVSHLRHWPFCIA